MSVVVDAGPLLALGKLGLIQVLHRLYDPVLKTQGTTIPTKHEKRWVRFLFEFDGVKTEFHSSLEMCHVRTEDHSTST